MKRVEYKLGNIVALLRFNEAKKFRQWQHRETEKSGTENQPRNIFRGRDAPTDLDVCLLVGRHLSEGERRDVAPHAKSLGDSPTRVAGVHQVCREGEQPARKQQHGVVNSCPLTHSSTAEESAKTQ